MPKLGMEPVRRKQLIDATIKTIHERGLDECTVKQISATAGVSAGIIHHYFGGKDELMRATMSQLIRNLSGLMEEKLDTAVTASDKLDAVISASFSEDVFQPQVVTAWLAFWSLMPHDDAIRDLQTSYSDEIVNILCDALKDEMSEGDAIRLAEGMSAMIDGLWLRCAFSNGAMGSAKAAGIVHDYVNTYRAAHKLDSSVAV